MPIFSPEDENDCHEVVDINGLVNGADVRIEGHSPNEEEDESSFMSSLDGVSLLERPKAVDIVRQVLAEKD